MIINLPKQFILQWLDNFDFGQPDAKEDALLSKCLCFIPAFDEFLRGNKDIVLGERGTGKSALFRLIKDKEYKFQPSRNVNKDSYKKQILVPK
ncbi:MAG: hypothetical protein ACR65O_01660 [Methylomicrobium sp.]